jgi:ribonuclease BN (tRNA processing enzyme)
MSSRRGVVEEGHGGLRLTVIGCAPAWALRPNQPSSCYLVELDTQAIALDLGQGSLGALAAVRSPETLRAVFISHLHADHHVDLIPLRYYLKYGLERPGSVELHVPGDLRSRYDAFLGEDGFLDDMPGEPVRAGIQSVGPFVVEARKVTHGPNAHAFRVSSAASPGAPALVYSGDCGNWQDLVPLIRAGDTLLCEAFWGANEPEEGANHLSAAEAASAATSGEAAHLILTHIPDAHHPNRAVERASLGFHGPVGLARPGTQLEVGGEP